MLLPIVASAFTGEDEVDGIRYYINTEKKTAEVRANSYSGDIVIPPTIEYDGVTCSVTSIGKRAFSSCFGLTSVTIPTSVTSIGDHAFFGCYSLTSVTIGTSVTSIGDHAFMSCSGLTSIMIPNSVTSIGNGTFWYCTSLTSVTIPNSVTSIGQWTFRGCSSLTSIDIPNSVTSIGEYTFYGCFSLTSVTIPNSVTGIGTGAFSECSSLTSVIIGNGVTYIRWLAFAECEKLTDFYCYAENIPITESNAFENSERGYATLHVPDVSVENYKKTFPWSGFGTIVGLEGTAIDATQLKAMAQTDDSPTYDLQGRRMAEGKPLHPGIYVKDGRKFVVKE